MPFEKINTLRLVFFSRNRYHPAIRLREYHTAPSSAAERFPRDLARNRLLVNNVLTSNAALSETNRLQR